MFAQPLTVQRAWDAMGDACALAAALHNATGHKELPMLNRVVHSVAARLVRGLVGTVVFVQASQHVSPEGLLALALGSALIISAGADVAPHPIDAVSNT